MLVSFVSTSPHGVSEYESFGLFVLAWLRLVSPNTRRIRMNRMMVGGMIREEPKSSRCQSNAG